MISRPAPHSFTASDPCSRRRSYPILQRIFRLKDKFGYGGFISARTTTPCCPRWSAMDGKQFRDIEETAGTQQTNRRMDGFGISVRASTVPVCSATGPSRAALRLPGSLTTTSLMLPAIFHCVLSISSVPLQATGLAIKELERVGRSAGRRGRSGPMSITHLGSPSSLIFSRHAKS